MRRLACGEGDRFGNNHVGFRATRLIRKPSRTRVARILKHAWSLGNSIALDVFFPLELRVTALLRVLINNNATNSNIQLRILEYNNFHTDYGDGYTYRTQRGRFCE